MLKRVTDPEECRRITNKYPEYFTFDEDAWFSDDRNWSMREGDDIAFAEYKSPGVYWVHVCFDTSRGKRAVEFTNKLIDTFCSLEDVKVLMGVVETKNKGANWLLRKCAFTYLETSETRHGYCNIFYKTVGNR